MTGVICMATFTINPNGDYAVLHQGSNSPLVVTLDMDATELTALSVSLWHENQKSGGPIKAWTMNDVNIDNDTVACPLTEEETAAFPRETLILEVKGLKNGFTVFWERFKVKVEARNDKNIILS